MKLSSYLSFEAFSSNTASLYDGPSIARAKHRILVVLPVPGGPWKQQRVLNNCNILLPYTITQ